jgi:hypothetical protein
MSKEHRRTIEKGGYELEVVYDYTPCRPGRMYLDNGDPGYPDDPPELDITAVYLNLPQVQLNLKDILDDLGALETIEQDLWEHLDNEGEEE